LRVYTNKYSELGTSGIVKPATFICRVFQISRKEENTEISGMDTAYCCQIQSKRMAAGGEKLHNLNQIDP
jgi:hypothetical protein